MPPRAPRHLSEEARNTILHLHGGGFSIHSIARRVGCSRSTVRRTMARFLASGSTQQAHSSGRPARLTAANEERLRQLCRRRPTATATAYAIATSARLMGIGRLTERYVRSFRQRLGFRAVTSLAQIPLSRYHRALRLAYCRRHQHSAFRHTAFSDEAMFRIEYTRRVFWLQRDQPRPTHPSYIHPMSFMVWGAVSWHTRSRLYIKPPFLRINSVRYTHILSHYYMPMWRADRSLRLLQDNAPPHASAHTRAWLRRHRVRLIDNYPPKSPDLNAIELIWAWMKQYVRARAPRNAQHLRQLIEQAWTVMPQRIIQAHINHIPTVVRGVIAAQGGRAGE